MTIPQLFPLALAALLAQQFLLAEPLGIPPLASGAQAAKTTLGMGLAVTLTMALATVALWAAEQFLLLPLGLVPLRLAAYVLILAGLMGAAGWLLGKCAPARHKGLAAYLPAVGIHCAVLGAALLNGQTPLGLLPAVARGGLAGLVFTLATVLFSLVWGRLAFYKYPKCLQGLPLALMVAGLLSMVFLGVFGLP